MKPRSVSTLPALLRTSVMHDLLTRHCWGLRGTFDTGIHVSSFIFNDRLKLNYWAGLRLAGLDGVELRGSELGCTGLEMGWVALSWAELALVRPKRWLICAFEDTTVLGWDRAGLGLGWCALQKWLSCSLTLKKSSG